jgi:2'-5' RNA ligase
MESYKDYLIILSPPEKINKIITDYKKRSVEIIGKYPAMHSKPHITINDDLPRQKPFMFEPLVNAMARNIEELSPIELKLADFSYFTNIDHYTIFADIENTEQTKRWFKQLRKTIRLKKFIKPHITVNRTISADSFNKLWPVLKENSLKESFTIDRLTVLCRESFVRDARYEIFAEIPFKGVELSDPTPQIKSIKPLKLINPSGDQQLSLF